MIQSVIWSVPIAWGLAIVPVVTRAVLVARTGKLDNSRPRDAARQTESMPKHLQELAGRLQRSHDNQLETLGYYAAGVAVAVAVRVPGATLARLTGMYIKSRIAYNFAYAAPQVANGALRSISFIAAAASIAMIYGAAAETAISTYE